MRNGSHRLLLCIAAVAAGSLIAVPAASAGVHEYDTHVGFTWDNPQDGTALFHDGAGGVESKVRKCEVGRRVVLFKRRPGADRKIATAESDFERISREGSFAFIPPKGTFHRGDRLYVQVKREVLNDGDVCRPDRSMTKTYPTQPDRRTQPALAHN